MADNIRFSTNEYTWGGQQPTPAVQGAVDLAKSEVEKALDVLQAHIDHLGEDSVIRVFVGGTEPPANAAHGDLWWGTHKWQRIAPFGNASATNWFTSQFPLQEDMGDFYVANGEVEPGLIEDGVQEIRYVQDIADEFRAGFVVPRAGPVKFSFRSTQVSGLRSFHLRALGFALDQRVVLESAETWQDVIVDAPSAGTIYLTPADITSRVGDVVFIKEISVGPDPYLDYFNGGMQGCSWIGTAGRSVSIYTPGWGIFDGFDLIIKLLTQESYNDGFVDIYMTADQPVFPDDGDLWYNGTALARWENITWVDIPIGGPPEIEDRIVIIEDDLISIENRINNLGDELEFPDLDSILDWIADSGAILDSLLGGEGVIPIAVIDSLWARIVRAKQITADMMLVGRGNNEIIDPRFNDEALRTVRANHSSVQGGWGFNASLNLSWYGGMQNVGATKTFYWYPQQPENGVYSVESMIPVQPGQVYRLKVTVNSTGGTGMRWVYRGVRTDGVAVSIGYVTPAYDSGSGVRQLEATFTIPDDLAYIVFGVQVASSTTAAYIYGDAQVSNALDPSLFVDGLIHATIGMATGGKFVADDDGTTRTEMSAQGIEHWGTVGESDDHSIPQRISKFGRDLQFLTPDGVKGIDENGDGSVRGMSIDDDPVIEGTPLLGTLALRNEEVSLDTQLGHLDQVSFAGNVATWVGPYGSTFPWTTTGEKTVAEVLREQQAGRAVMVILSGTIRAAVTSGNDAAFQVRLRKTQLDLPTSTLPSPPSTSSTTFGDTILASGVGYVSFARIMGLHTPSRSELARWLITVNRYGGVATDYNVRDLQLAFVDMGPRSDAGLDMVNRIVLDEGTTPPPSTPTKQYTSRWYANSINRWQGDYETPSGDRAGQALQGWASGFNGPPFHSILGFTGNAHYGETGRSISNVLSGATISRVRIRTSHVGGFGNIPARLGIQASSTAVPVINQTVTPTSPGQTLYHVMSSTFRNGLQQGMRYITFGPHTRSGNHYASYHGTSGGNSRRVELEITYTR